MAFKSFAVSLATTNTDVIECPATTDGAAKIVVGNVSGSSRTYTLKLYKQSSGITKTVTSAVAIAANTSVPLPPISMEAGDKIIMLCSNANDIVATGAFTYAAASPPEVGFTGRGTWDSGATYAINDVAEKNGTSYLSIQGSNTNQDPESASDFWMILASKGSTGDGDLSAANNLSDLGDPAVAFGNIKQAATDTATGVVELATAAEVATGTDTARAVTPAGAATVYSPTTRPTNAQTGTTYTFVLTDAGKLCTFSNGSAITVTVPPNSDVAFPVGTQIDVAQLGAGKTTFAQGSGVTINSIGSLKALSNQYAGGTLIKTATDVWLLIGSLIA